MEGYLCLCKSLLLHPPTFFQLFSMALIVYLLLRALRFLLGDTGRRTSAVAPPPGSTGLPLIGETLAFIAANKSSKGVYEFVRTRHQRYGKCFKTGILGNTHVFMSSTEVAKALLGHESVDFSKRYIRSIAELLGDQSLLCASHEQHKFIRCKIANLFNSESMALLIQNFDKSIIKTLSSWKQKESVLVLNEALKIVKESLRMATIVSWFPRVALKDCEIGGSKIQKGWIVNVDARSIHFDPTLYDDPMNFNPSRFDEDPKPYSFLAFGTGGRTCLGMNLAKAMMLVFLHRLVTTYRWKVVDPDTSLEKGSMFPMLRSGCPITVTPLAEKPKLRQN